MTQTKRTCIFKSKLLFLVFLMILNTVFLLSVSQAGAVGSFDGHGSDKFTKWKFINIHAGMTRSATFKKTSKSPTRLGSSLNQLLKINRVQGFSGARAFAMSHNIVIKDDLIQVTIIADIDVLDDLKADVQTEGGEYELQHGNRLQVMLPISKLEELASKPGVILVREPRRAIALESYPNFNLSLSADNTPPAPPCLNIPKRKDNTSSNFLNSRRLRATAAPFPMAGNQTSEGVYASNANILHADNINGLGVKIAVIDAGFTGYTGLFGTDLPSAVTTYNWTSTGMDVSPHGTACAEIVHDMAPGAEICLHKIGTDVEFGNAVDQAISDGVDIITMSLGWLLDGPGDGTGFLSDIISHARESGIFFATAAGNNAENCWSGVYEASDNNTHLWSSDQDINWFGPGDGTAYNIPAGYPLVIGLHWNDWTAVDQDYDLFLFYRDGSEWRQVASSVELQHGDEGQTPEEFIWYYTSEAGVYGVVVVSYSATRAVDMRLVTSHAGPSLDQRVEDRSLTFPADSQDAVTVAAVDVDSPYELEYYSSRGATFGPGGSCMGGVIKPDIASYANVSTVSYGPGVFNGTSSATPHVAGAAALIKDANPDFTVDQLQACLEGRALDLGDQGKDNLYGAGRLYLSSENSLFELWEDAPFGSMDGVVIGYNGLIYLAGGYGSDGQVGIFNPVTRTWTTGDREPSPQIEYPGDGAFGLNKAGEPVIILFPDTTGNVSGIMHRYNTETNKWDTPSLPDGFPEDGQWAHDIVSLFPITGENICYISGGASHPGGGDLNTLWEYHPDTNTITNLGNFTHHPYGFDFHSSWYVPWIGESGAICVGGGVDLYGNYSTYTQCYDIASATFNVPNADLGEMPEPLWGAADMIMVDGEGDDNQLWAANGVSGNSIWSKSIYYSSREGKWLYGPDMPHAGYRLEGVRGTMFGVGYTFGGSEGFFIPIEYNQIKTPEFTKKITLFTPNGGVLPSGAIHKVLWGAPSNAVSFKIKYSLNNGKKWKLIDKGVGGRSCFWEVPEPKRNRKNCRIKVIGYNASGKRVGADKSDTRITVAVVNITSPNGGELLSNDNSPWYITWSTGKINKEVGKVKLFFSKNNGRTWQLINIIEGNPGIYEYSDNMPKPAKPMEKCLVKVVLKDEKGKTLGKDKSDVCFSIAGAAQ